MRRKTFLTADRRSGIAAWFVTAILLALISAAGAQAEETRLVTWDALVPGSASDTQGMMSTPRPSADRTGALPHSQLPDSGALDPITQQALGLSDWSAAHFDVSPAVMHRQILLDGYVLPLAWDGVRVVDFLLVPWVGACIHMPAPPPNQIVRVSYPEGLVLEKQFEAVRLSGVLKQAVANYDLFLVDGHRSIPVSYELVGAQIAGTPGKIIALSASDLPRLAQLQLWITTLFTDSMQAVASDGSSKALIMALLLSFGYGALHTLGPGHGKSVVISYFVGTGGSLRRGLSMGVQIAVFHVFSAVVVVFLLDLAVRQATGSAPSDFRAIRLGSYALIIAIGSVMLWQALAALRARQRDFAVLLQPSAQAFAHAGGHTQSHDHHHHNHEHSHHHAHDHGHDHASHAHHSHAGCSACAAAAAPKGSGWIAASVGVVPCTGALLVMLFGLANDLVFPAVLMVVSISAGMALAMSAIGVFALYGRRIAETRMANRPDRILNFDMSARLIGATCVLAIGLLLFGLTLSYPPVMQAPPNDVASGSEQNVSAGG